MHNCHHIACAASPRVLTLPAADPDAGGLERGLVQRHGEDEPLGRPLLRGAHDLWQLRAVQPAGRHPGRRLLVRGKVHRKMVL